MAEIAPEKLPRKLKEILDKGSLALDRGNTDYATSFFNQVLAMEPRCLAARKNLRFVQIKRALAKKPSLSSVKGAFTLMGGQGKLGKDPKAALAAAEKLMELDPTNLSFLKFYVDAANGADLPEAAVMTLELARAALPKDVDFLNLLAQVYIDNGNPGAAKECYAAVCKLRPNDQAAIKRLKDAAALDTMKTGNWEDTKSDYRSKLKDQKVAQRLEQEHRTVQGSGDVESLIKARLADIEREPLNMNFRRAVADLYLKASRFDDALAALDDAEKAAGRTDPQIEKMKSSIKVKKFDAQIAAAGDAEKAALEEAKAQFIFEDALDMAKRYPNDLQCRYELGVQYFSRAQYTEAIEEFQLSQRNPQRRIRSLYYLARCFTAMGQIDLGFDQLKKAKSELTLMDDDKKDIVYEMGLLAEQMGRKDEAVGYYKEIYEVDITYRDVAKKIQAAYQKA
jgi:tetratricopeptide (TPR) repeat protein